MHGWTPLLDITLQTLAKKENIPLEDAMDKFYTSKAFELIQDPRLGYRTYSPDNLIELYERKK